MDAMNKQDIKRSIEQKYGAFVNVTEVAEYLKVDRGTARGVLNGLAYLPNGREKQYFTGDVADRIMERIRT